MWIKHTTKHKFFILSAKYDIPSNAREQFLRIWPLFDSKVHLFENSLLKIMAQLSWYSLLWLFFKPATCARSFFQFSRPFDCYAKICYFFLPARKYLPLASGLQMVQASKIIVESLNSRGFKELYRALKMVVWTMIRDIALNMF